MDTKRFVRLFSVVAGMSLIVGGTFVGNICIAVLGLLIMVGGIFALEELNKNL